MSGKYSSEENPPKVRMLRTGQAAERLRVHPKTVTRWAKEGKLECVFTPGGQRMFRKSDVDELAKRRRMGYEQKA